MAGLMLWRGGKIQLGTSGLARSLALLLTFLAVAAVELSAFYRVGAAASIDSTGTPQVIIGPPGETQLREMLRSPQQWAEVQRRVGGLLYADHSFKKISDDELRSWFSDLASWGLELELEVGAVKDWSAVGVETYAKQRPTWSRLERLGGKFSSIAIDEPLVATRRFLHLPDDYAVLQTAQFIREVRRDYPQLRIGDIEPFPYLTVNEHQWWITRLQAALSEMGVSGLDFYRVDPDWIAFTLAKRGSWQDIRAIHQFCKSMDIRFSLIYWASNYPRAKKLHIVNEMTWYEGLMEEGLRYAETKDSPDQYVIESWVGAPLEALPEGDSTSFTGSVLSFLNQYVH